MKKNPLLRVAGKGTRLFCVGMMIASMIAFAGCSGAVDGQKAAAQDAADGKISVYTSFYPMYDFAVKIGGNKVSVTNLTPAGTEPHDWEPTAWDVANLENANVFIYNGAGMEQWVDSVLASLDNKNLTVVEATAGMQLLQETETAGEENMNEQADPHVWLSPVRAEEEMKTIKDAFVSADPANAAYYESNYEEWSEECGKLDAEYKETFGALLNKDLIVAHQAFGYLCADYGLNQVAIEGVAADSEPDPARVAEIISFAKEHSIKVIFFEEMVSPKVAQAIADAIGAKTDVLNPLEGLSDDQLAAGEDYFSVMRENLAAIQAALS